MTSGRQHWSTLCGVLLALSGANAAHAQTPTGAIVGVVRDATRAEVAGARIVVTSRQTGLTRPAVSSDRGRYAVAVLPPGDYALRATHPLGRSPEYLVAVNAGGTAVLDLALEVEGVRESVTVRADDRLRADHHQVGGWIDRSAVESQPLNGRNVLELVKLEPGVRAPERLPGGRVFIAALGAGLQTIPRIGFTRVTLDGANIETPGTTGTVLLIPPDIVDQMHVATANFDASTGLGTSGAVNVVTRSGGNRLEATSVALFRHRDWSSLPSEQASASDPAFWRHQAGITLGGPIRRDRAFFLAGYERADQRQSIVVRPTDPALRALGGVFSSPSTTQLTSARVDVRLSDGHRMTIRSTRTASDTFTTSGGAPHTQLPSAWASRPVRAHQAMASVTSVLSPAVVNDLRISRYATDVAQLAATGEACDAGCLGLGAPRVVVTSGDGAGLTIGSAPEFRAWGSRWQLSNSLVWQRGAHVVRLGGDWEHVVSVQNADDGSFVQMTLWSPAAAGQSDPSLPLPGSIATLDDLYRLPLRAFTASAAAPGVTRERERRGYDVLRLHASDQWRLGARVSANAGLAWAYEPGVLNHDLEKPAWLAPLLGAERLRVPAAHRTLSALGGVAWQASADGRTIVRGGVGRYFDSIARTVALNLATERALLSPAGSDIVSISGANVFWNGRRLVFPAPSTFSGNDLLAILPDIRELLAVGPGQGATPGVTNLDVAKEGQSLYDPSYQTPRALHATAGVARELGDGLVVSGDVVWKRFSHTFINGIDYNRFFSAAGPVIPACSSAQRTDAAAVCSNGSLYFDTTSGRARYLGLLIRAERRFRAGAGLLASYAYGSFVGTNGTGTATTESSGGRVFGFSNDDWSRNYGPLPLDLRHLLHVSGLVDAPWRLRLAFSLSAASRPPFAPYVAGMDFDGDGTFDDLLPGTVVNQFNRGLDRTDLVELVKQYNEQYAGRPTAGGQIAPVLTLPEDYAFDDTFFTLDVRISRELRLAGSVRMLAFVDVFNVFDTKNHAGYASDLTSPDSFGQPGYRAGQAFGSGGPRAAQIGVRVAF